MDETYFNIIALKQLADITERLESTDNEGLLEIEFLDGILEITLEDGGEYVINKHTPSQQIWVSSPVSGASYYAYDEGTKEWRSTKGGTLQELLVKELQERAGFTVVL